MVRCCASHQSQFHLNSMYGGPDASYGSNNVKIDKEGSSDVWNTWKWWMIIRKRRMFFFINWGGSKWITMDNFRCDTICVWNTEIHHFWGSLPAIVFYSCDSIYCHFEAKTLIIEFLWIKFRLKSFLELHVHFSGLMCTCMRKVHTEYQIQANACDWS